MARLRTAAGTGHATRRVRGNDATVLRDVAAEVRVWRVAQRAAHLDKAGFSLFDVGEQHRLSDKGLTKDGILFQLDLLFVRKGGRFTRQAQTAIERFGAHSRGVAPVDDELALVRSRRSVSQID